MATFLSANSIVGLGLQSARGTAATTSINYIPVSGPQVSPMLTFLQDMAFRGSPTTIYDQVEGVRHDEFDLKCYLYADTFPILLKSILGGTDNVTGSTLYTHVMGLYNSATAGSQPPALTIINYDAANSFQLIDGQSSNMTISFGAEQAVEVSQKISANPYQVSTSAPSSPAVSFSSEHMVPGWNTALTIAGTSINYVEDGEVTLERSTAPIFTMGQQSPYRNFAGPLQVSGRFTAVVDSQTDIWTALGATGSYGSTTGYGLNRSPQAVTLTFTDSNDTTSGTAHSVKLQMSAVQFHDVKRNVGKAYTEVEASFTASANATDVPGTGAGYSGYSPILATIKNATASYPAS